MSLLSDFAGSGGLGILPMQLFNQGGNAGSKRDAAPQPSGGMPSYNPNLDAPANFWQGNQLMIPGAQGLGSGATMPMQPPPAPQGGFGGLMGRMGGGGMGGLAGLLGGMGMGGGQMPGSGSSTLPTQPQQQPGNPGIQGLLQLLMQGRQ